jgi:hypothetical protein
MRFEAYAQAFFAFWLYIRLGGQELDRERGLRGLQAIARSVRNVRRSLARRPDEAALGTMEEALHRAGGTRGMHIL